jgi:hypothetical protein
MYTVVSGCIPLTLPSPPTAGERIKVRGKFVI